MKTAVAYARLSKPNKKGKPGIGLDVQQAAIAAFASAEGYNLLETFSETETGAHHDALDKRPQLAAAMKLAKKHKAPVIVMKLDRLSRDVHFISGLMVERVCSQPWRRTLLPERRASLDQEKAGGRYAAGLVLQLPARGSGSVALRSVDLIGSTEHLVDAIAHGYEVAKLT